MAAASADGAARVRRLGARGRLRRRRLQRKLTHRAALALPNPRLSGVVYARRALIALMSAKAARPRAQGRFTRSWECAAPGRTVSMWSLHAAVVRLPAGACLRGQCGVAARPTSRNRRRQARLGAPSAALRCPTCSRPVRRLAGAASCAREAREQQQQHTRARAWPLCAHARVFRGENRAHMQMSEPETAQGGPKSHCASAARPRVHAKAGGPTPHGWRAQMTLRTGARPFMTARGKR